jgi:hypothetical protein
LSTNGTSADVRKLTGTDGELLPIKIACDRLKISVATYKRLHLADKDAWPAKRVGVQWRVPGAFVTSMTAWPQGGQS